MAKVIVQKSELGNIDSSLDYFLRFKIPKNKKILDVGCNYGSLIYNIYKNGYKNIHGIDINKKSVNKGKKIYKKIKDRIKFYDGKKIPWGNDYFDIVLMFDVIEHIKEIENFLKNEVNRVLKKNGLFIFQTPNKIINFIWLYIKNKEVRIEAQKEHCSLQTYFSLKKLIKDSNFKYVKIEKHEINTIHNRYKINKKFGRFGLILIPLFSKLPIILYPNFWGFSKIENHHKLP
jgi:2-polyprenyl-3-methyl-5-hydroxy-6-metoxy-1,4-benzoquinol methylase